jgi:hypothetical protein
MCVCVCVCVYKHVNIKVIILVLDKVIADYTHQISIHGTGS